MNNDDRKKANYNIYDYVKNTNTSFDECSFNEIDGLVFTQISNMDLSESGIDLYSGNAKKISEIWSEMNTENTVAHAAYLRMGENDKKLIAALANSKRYSNMDISNFVENPAKSNIDGFLSVGVDEHMEQFAAVTITYEQNGKIYNYISYRATDGTSDGWAEDLAMLYSMNTQAQSDSTAYMNIIAEMKEGYITGGGHSKGGGNFEYAYLFCDDDVRERIVKGYVYDSPGLSEEVISLTQYYENYQKTIAGSFICPQDSIIGQILHEADNAFFVHSVENGFNQHDPYTWEINSLTNTFASDTQTELSKYLNDALDSAVVNMTQKEKEAFFSFVSYLLYNNGGEGIDGLGGLFASGWKNKDGSFNWRKLEEIWDVISADWKEMTQEEKKAFLDSFGVIVVAFSITAYDYIEGKIEQWIEKKKEEFERKFQEAWKTAADWLNEKREEFMNFLSNAYKSVVSNFSKVSIWIKEHSVGYQYAVSNPQICLDTYKLRDYAQRIQNINQRINNLDKRMDSLYWRVGLLDLWNLIQADIFTGYSWRLLRCSSYLYDTASDFDFMETELINMG